MSEKKRGHMHNWKLDEIGWAWCTDCGAELSHEQIENILNLNCLKLTKALLDISWHIGQIGIYPQAFVGQKPECMDGWDTTSDGGTRNKWGDGHNDMYMKLTKVVVPIIYAALGDEVIEADEEGRRNEP